MQLDYYRIITLDRPSQSFNKATTTVARESTNQAVNVVPVTSSSSTSGTGSDAPIVPGLVPSSSSELDALLDRMLEIQTGSSTSFNVPSESSTQSQPAIPRRESTGLVESLLGEDRSWAEPPTHSGIFLPTYYTGQQMGLYPNPLEHPIPYYSGTRPEYAQQGYLHQPAPLHSYGYTMYGIPSLNHKFRQRHPFERAISSPEFYTPPQFYGEIKRLGSGQSQSLPTFEGSMSDLDKPVTSSITSSPETVSPLNRSPLGYGMETSMFSYGFSSSPSLPGPSGLQLQKVRKSSPSLFMCTVCGDTAQCLHYGVRTCEGCKGFFKRSVQKKSKYVCLGNKDCVIDKRRRNRCQYCRYQKCLSVGMVKEVVRTDSLKGRRGRLPSKSKSSDESVSQSLTKSLLNAFTSGTAAHHRPTSSAVVVSNPTHLVDSICSSINAVHRWVDRLPVWTRIIESDRDKLAQNACISILSFRIAFLSFNNVTDGQLVFDDGMVYSINSCEELWKPWLTSIADLSMSIKSLFGQDLSGFCCLKALLLFMSENANLEKVEECDKIKNNIINCLKEHCTYSVEAKTKPTQYFSAILAMVNDVYAVGKKGKECYMTFKWKPLQMPPLLVDAFGV